MLSGKVKIVGDLLKCYNNGLHVPIQLTQWMNKYYLTIVKNVNIVNNES